MDFKRLRDFQEKLVAWRIPGNDCIVYKDGEEVYRYMTGYADVESGRKMRGDELYYFWSATKVITTSLALRLLEEGVYTMNDPLGEYIPEFKNMTVRRMIDGKEEIVPAKNQILIRHLFNMTAGFDYNFNTPDVNSLRFATGNKFRALDFAKALAKSPLHFEPGERWNYSLCHDVLGAFIESITGKRLRDYAKEVLFDPLGMDDTCYNLPSEDKMSRMATQYSFRDDLGKYVPTQNSCGHILCSEYDSGGAGIVTGAADYMKFASCIAEGGTSKDGYRYISKNTIDLWRRNTLSDEILKRDYNWSFLAGYGYGFGVRTMMCQAATGSPGTTSDFGWGGAAGVNVVIDPESRLALVYVQHMLNSQEAYISPRLRNILYSCI